MSPGARAGLVVALGAAWFYGVGPVVSDWAGRLAAGPPVQVAARRAASGAEREVWSRAVAALLDDDERSRGLRAAGTVPPAVPEEGAGPLDAELDQLAREILERYGEAPPDVRPIPVDADLWPGVSREERARAARALVREGLLPKDRAHRLLSATLRAG